LNTSGFDTLGRSPQFREGDRSSDDEMLPHLIRIVRRALRHSHGETPLAKALRSAAEQIDLGPAGHSSFANELRVRQVAQRLSAVLTPGFRDPPGRGAALETMRA
jgi:hypothetical protein